MVGLALGTYGWFPAADDTAKKNNWAFGMVGSTAVPSCALLHETPQYINQPPAWGTVGGWAGDTGIPCCVDKSKKLADGKTAATECGNDCGGCFECDDGTYAGAQQMNQDAVALWSGNPLVNEGAKSSSECKQKCLDNTQCFRATGDVNGAWCYLYSETTGPKGWFISAGAISWKKEALAAVSSCTLLHETPQYKNQPPAWYTGAQQMKQDAVALWSGTPLASEGAMSSSECKQKCLD